MMDFKLYQNKVADLCKTLGVKKLYIFGSAVRDDFKDTSDIDFLLSFNEGSNQFKRYFKLKNGLENIFKRECDILMEDGIKNPLLKKYINQERKVYYET
ncbi:MAG: nucleotidyltransferase domain-containing protein [Desulfobacterales bacterium]